MKNTDISNPEYAFRANVEIRAQIAYNRLDSGFVITGVVFEPVHR